MLQKGLLIRLKGTGLTLGQPKVLDYLKEHNGASQKEIAKELVVDEQDVVEMNRRIGGDKSLNVSVYSSSDDESKERIDMLADSRQNVEGRVANKQEAEYKRKILLECLATLNEREQFIIKNRMLTDQPVTLDEIGNKFNISRERVRQIEKRAFEKLSEEVKSRMAA